MQAGLQQLQLQEAGEGAGTVTLLFRMATCLIKGLKELTALVVEVGAQQVQERQAPEGPTAQCGCATLCASHALQANT